MCLIIAATARQVRSTLLNTPGLIADIYESNSDGIGAMFVARGRKLRVPKIVPANLADAERFIRQLPDDDRQLALHWRYKTHGDIDLTNCHPYPIVEGQIHFMHNGVLSRGNKADPTKSDTWHYAADVLAPQLSVYPDLFKLPAWIDLIEEDIGNGNRFVFMDTTGEMVIANKHTGIEHDGIWFSNTYAWTPSLLIPDYRKPITTYGRSGGYGSYGMYGGYGSSWDRDHPQASTARTSALTTAGAVSKELVPASTSQGTNGYYNTAIQEDVWLATTEGDTDKLATLIADWPVSVFNILFDGMGFFTNDPNSLTAECQQVCRLLEDQDEVGLRALIGQSHAKRVLVAECICYFGDWIDLTGETDEPDEQPSNVVALPHANGYVADDAEVKSEIYAG